MRVEIVSGESQGLKPLAILCDPVGVAVTLRVTKAKSRFFQFTVRMSHVDPKGVT